MEGSAVGSRMQERETGPAPRTRADFLPLPRPTDQHPASCHRLWTDLGLLLLLVAFAVGVRTWLISRTEVAARDSIGFIRYALELESQPWNDVLSKNLQHPGYPLVLMVVSWPVRYVLGGVDCFSMQLSAQLASSLAGILLVAPMFYLGRELFHRSAGFWGAVLFQCLPVSSRILSDGLSEATFLLFATMALLFAVQGMRTSSVVRFALSGLFTGMAYLTRPEGALLLAATGLVLVGVQFTSRWRQRWTRTFLCGTSLVTAALAVGGPYPCMTGQFTKKPSVLELLPTAERRPPSANGGHPLTASIFAVYAPPGTEDRRLWGFKAIGTEVVKGYHYFIGLPVLLGMWWFRDRLRVVRGAWVLLVLCVLHGLVLYRLAVRVGYLSERHVQLLVLCSIFTGAAAVSEFGQRLWALGFRLWPYQQARLSLLSWLTVALFLALACSGLPEALKPLHTNRAGHRAAGLWLAQNAMPTDEVIDPNCWAHYYAGRVFLEGKTPPSPGGTKYVVLETADSEHAARLPMIEKAKSIARQGKVVYHWPVESIETEAKILVFAVPPS